jgi:putative DNA primase/helicase
MTSDYDAAKYLANEAGISVNGHQPLLTEYGNAQRLVEWHREDLRYNYDWRKWLVWLETHWTTNGQGEIMRRAKATVKQMYEMAGEMATAASLEQEEGRRTELGRLAEASLKWARQSESRRILEATIALAESEPGIPVNASELDANPWFINCPNGILDLQTAALEGHTREALLTKITNVPYDPDAQCPQWLTFLERIMNGNQQLITFLQRAMGYALTGQTGEHCLFVLYGSGRNGKSTFLGTFLDMLGDYARKGPSDLLLLKKGEAHPTERSVLHGVRFVPCIETEEGRRMDETMVKELTGGDKVSTRRMREDFWEFKPVHHLFLGTNHKPTIKGTDLAIWSRIRLIPFKVTIPLQDRDTNLPDKLKEEWPGIFAWAVQGCLDWQRDGLGEPVEVWRATQEYRTEMDVLGAFIDDQCVVEDDTRATSTALYDSYLTWGKNVGERTLRKQEFGIRLEERGFIPARGAKGVRIWKGIRLLQQGEEPPMQAELLRTEKGDVGDVGDIDSRMNELGNDSSELMPEPASPTSPTSPDNAGDVTLDKDPWDVTDDDIGI